MCVWHLALLDQHCSALSAKAVVYSSRRPCVLNAAALSLLRWEQLTRCFLYEQSSGQLLKSVLKPCLLLSFCEAVQSVVCCFPGVLISPGFSKMICAVLILYHAGRYHISFTTRSSTVLGPHWKDRAIEFNIAPFMIKHN